MDTLPEIPLNLFLLDHDNADAKESCLELAKALQHFGAVVVRDPRVTTTDNTRFLTLMESYYALPETTKMKDARPELHYQVGVTPDGVERPRTDRINEEAAQRYRANGYPPHPVHGSDPKWRFLWRIGPRPKQTEFPEMNADPVVPEQLSESWADVMDTWGEKLRASAETVAQMLAIGLGFDDPQVLTRLMENGPHLLAPTGVDLDRYGRQTGTVLAGFHYDLNLMSLHGKARFPGLFVWTREGVRIPVRVPDGCLLVQAGIQLEWLTGGRIQRGYHEVVVSEETTRKYLEERAKSSDPCWRVSSTMFIHVATDKDLYPLMSSDESLSEDGRDRYPRIKAGEQVREELKSIALAPLRS